MAPTTALRSLRVTAELDVNRYVGPAQQKVAADNAMSASSKQAGAAQTELNTKVSQAGDPLIRLSRQFVSGYGDAERFNRALMTLSRGVDSGNISLAQAQPILDGMHRRYGLVADASLIAARGQTELAALVTAANSRLEQQEAAADGAAMAHTRLASATRMASFQQRNLAYQWIDVTQMLALGQNPLMTFLQQGPQIAQIYGPDEGGLGRAFSESAKMIGGFLVKAAPVALVVGGIAAAIAGIQHEINETSRVTVSYGDVALATWQVISRGIAEWLKPATEQISDWFGAAWDWTVDATRKAGNFIVREMVGATDIITTTIASIPDAFIAAGEAAANGFIAAIEWMVRKVMEGIQAAIDGVNGFIDMFGGDMLRDKLGWAPELPSLVDPNNPFTIGRADIGGAAAQERLNGGWSASNRRRESLNNWNPMEDFFGAIKDQSIKNALAPSDEDLKAMAKAEDAYKRLIARTEERIAGLEAEAEAMGLSRIEAMSLVNLHELVADAERTGVTLTEQRIEQLTLLAERYTDAQLALQGLHMEMSNKSPWDTMAEQIAFLNEQLARGNISWQTYAAEAGKALEDMVGKYAAAASGILGQVQNLTDAMGQQERQRIENSGLAGEELTAALEDQARRQFETNKKIALANAAVAGAEAVVKSYNWGTTLGGPVGGAIAAGIAAAATVAQISAIASSTYEAPSRSAAAGGGGSAGAGAAQQPRQTGGTLVFHGSDREFESIERLAKGITDLVNADGANDFVLAIQRAQR